MSTDQIVSESGDFGTAMDRDTLKILVVDDDELDRRAVCRCLRQCGIPVRPDQAATAEETLNLLKANRYDCILLDYYIPGVDARRLLNGIREAAPGMPVVIFTGRGDEEIAVEFMKAGVADYLPKISLGPERLASSLRHALELQRAAEARQRTEEDLRAQETRFRTLANTIPQLAWIADPSGARIWFNDRWYAYTGTTFEEVRGWGWQQLHHPDHVQRTVAGFRRSVAAGAAWEDTYPLRGKDGNYRWFLARAQPIRNQDGSIAGWMGTNTDITEQKAAEAERERLLALEREARVRAENAIKARDEILAIVAHDLRNPMQTIMTAATMLKMRGNDEHLRQENVSLILTSITEMERQIADLLDVARIEAGSLAIRTVRVDARDLIHHVVERFQPRAHELEITLSVESAAALKPLNADRDRLIQVLSNLVGNALKFTPPGGRITLRVVSLQSSLQLSVIDTGPGISAEHLPHVFDRYWQVDRLSRSGAGLGLAICKGIVEAHGGRIWVESTIGQGTTVHFTVPCMEGEAC